MIFKDDIINVKENIQENVGRKVKIRGNLTRSKFTENEGVINKVYENNFLIRDEKNERNITYSYIDILTKNVEVNIYDGEKFNQIQVCEDISKKER